MVLSVYEGNCLNKALVSKYSKKIYLYDFDYGSIELRHFHNHTQLLKE